MCVYVGRDIIAMLCICEFYVINVSCYDVDVHDNSDVDYVMLM